MTSGANYSRVKSLIIDFDSVICGEESLDILFKETLSQSPLPLRERIVSEVRKITQAGMEGEIPFSESLKRRLALLPDSPPPFEAIIARLSGAISESFLAGFPRWNLERIVIISSGFRQLIGPVLTPLGVKPEQIFCNSFKLDENGHILALEKDNPLAGDQGKVAVTRSLNLPRETVVVGDGKTDLEIVESGAADYFFCYTEFVRRESVASKANEIISSFTELEGILNLTDGRRGA